MYKTIVTHSGTFHADEVFATAILTTINPEANVIRTRDEAILGKHRKTTSSILVDVGLLYDGIRLGDHHMNDVRLESYKVGFSPVDADKETILIMPQVFLANKILMTDADMNKAVSKYLNKTKFPARDSILSYMQGGMASHLAERVGDFVAFVESLRKEGVVTEINGRAIVFDESFVNKAKILLQGSVLYRKLSSLGIVWKVYGADYVKKYVATEISNGKRGYSLITGLDISAAVQSVDFTLVRLIDLMDNGISYTDTTPSYSIGDVIANYNTNTVNSDVQDEAFNRAVSFAKDFLQSMLNRTFNAIVIEKSVFDKEYVPGAELQIFSEFVPKVEYLLGKREDEATLYYVFRTEEGYYRIMTVRRSGFSDKKSLPKEWIKINENGELTTPGLRFVHQALFTAEFTDLDSLKIALCLKN